MSGLNASRMAADIEHAGRWLRDWLDPLLLATEPPPPERPGAGTGHRPLISRPTEQAAMSNVADDREWLPGRQVELAHAAASLHQAATRFALLARDTHNRLPWDDKRWGRTCSVAGCGGTPRAKSGGPCSGCESYHRRNGEWPPAEVLEAREIARQRKAILALGEIVHCDEVHEEST